ncbi:unnamed protein product [Caenorhabditis brenneri]
MIRSSAEANLIDIQERLRKLVENFKEEEDTLNEIRESIDRYSKSILVVVTRLKDLPDNDNEERKKLLEKRRKYEKSFLRDQLLIQDIENDRARRNTPGNEKLGEVIEKIRQLPGEMTMFIWNLIACFEAVNLVKPSTPVNQQKDSSRTDQYLVPRNSNTSSVDKNSSKLGILSNHSNSHSLDNRQSINRTQSLVPQTTHSSVPESSNSAVRRSWSSDGNSPKPSNTYDRTQSLIPQIATSNSTVGNAFDARNIQSLSINPGIFATLSSKSSPRVAQNIENSSTSEELSKLTDSLIHSLGPKPQALNLDRNDDPKLQNQTMQFGQKLGEEVHHEKQQIEQRAVLQLQIQEEKLNEKHILDMRRSENEALEKQRKAENDRKRELEFLKKMDKKEEEIEQNVRRAKENRKRYEKETKQLIDEILNRSRQTCETLLYCLQMQFQFEQKEREWSDCLQTLRDAIAIAKNQFSHFSNSMGTGTTYQKDDPIMNNEVEKLHRLTLVAYNLICNVWYKMEPSSKTTYSDRIFLRILLVNFTEICKRLYNVLKAIDDFEGQKETLRTLSDAFSKVNAFDVYDTRQLRDLSKNANPADYEYIERPAQYIKSTQRALT